MKQTQTIAPGTRVRNADGLIGSVEQIEYRTIKSGKQPKNALVLSDDGRWHYSIPMRFIGDIMRNDHQDVVHIAIPTEELQRYILQEKTTTSDTLPIGVKEILPTDAAATLTIPLAAEELVVTTRPIQRGTLHLHKSVATEEQTFTVATIQERVIVEHIPAAQFDAENASTSDDLIIPIMEERLVVHKEQVITEYIRIHKERVTQHREVHDTVRREILTINQEHRDKDEAAIPLVHMIDDLPK